MRSLSWLGPLRLLSREKEGFSGCNLSLTFEKVIQESRGEGGR